MVKRIFPVVQLVRITYKFTILLIAVLFAGSGTAWGATFGNTTDNGSTINIKNNLYTTHFTLSEDGLATSMTMKLLVVSSNKNFRGVIYRGSDSALVGYTEVKSIAAGTSTVTFNFYPPLRLFAGTYRLGAWASNALGTGAIYNNSVGSLTYSSRALTYSNQTYPTDIPSAYSTGEMHIYCTYAPGTPAIFGDTTIGTSTTTIEGTITGGTYIAPAYASRLDSVAVWMDVTDIAGTSAKLVKMAAYDSLSGALLDTTYSRSINIDDDMDGHRLFHFSNPPTLTASQPVVLSSWCDTSSATFSISYQGTSGLSVVLTSSNYFDAGGVYPDPHGGTKGGGYRINTFAYVTAVSAGGVNGRRRRILLEQSWLWQEAKETFAFPISEEVEK